MRVYLYTLEDPDTGEIRYVGKTVQRLKDRLASHMSKVKNEGRKSYVYSWIKSLTNQGKSPVMELLDIVDEDSWEEEEKFYISYFKYLGFRLTNCAEGGNTGPMIARKAYTKRIGPIITNNKSIKSCDLSTGDIKHWNSIVSYARFHNLTEGVVKDCIKSGHICGNSVVALSANEFKFQVRCPKNPIILVKDNISIAQFTNIKELARLINMDNSTISKMFRNGKLLLNMFNIKYKYESLP